MREVAGIAVSDAGLSGADIDAVVVGHFNPGLVAQGFTAGLAAGLLPGLQMVPAVRVENACATGSAAIHHAQALIASGQARHVLAIGVEVMSAINRHWVILGAARVSQLKGDARRSPLTVEPTGYSVSVGLAYRCCR